MSDSSENNCKRFFLCLKLVKCKFLLTYALDKIDFFFFRMNSKLLIMSLIGLACTINGESTDSTKSIANVPKPPNQLIINDPSSPQ